MTITLRTMSIFAVLACVIFTFQNKATAVEPASTGPKLGFAFTEIRPSIEELRFAFECEDGLEIEARWIAQNVGEAAPPNYVIGTYKMVTRGPLNVTRLSRPTKGWPLGLYRLELVHQGKPFHIRYYVIDDAQAK